jgi:hypothetical protein
VVALFVLAAVAYYGSELWLAEWEEDVALDVAATTLARAFFPGPDESPRKWASEREGVIQGLEQGLGESPSNVRHRLERASEDYIALIGQQLLFEAMYANDPEGIPDAKHQPGLNSVPALRQDAEAFIVQMRRDQDSIVSRFGPKGGQGFATMGLRAITGDWLSVHERLLGRRPNVNLITPSEWPRPLPDRDAVLGQ